MTMAFQSGGNLPSEPLYNFLGCTCCPTRNIMSGWECETYGGQPLHFLFHKFEHLYIIHNFRWRWQQRNSARKVQQVCLPVIVESLANRTSSLYLRLEISKGDLILPSGWLSFQLPKSCDSGDNEPREISSPLNHNQHHMMFWQLVEETIVSQDRVIVVSSSFLDFDQGSDSRGDPESLIVSTKTLQRWGIFSVPVFSDQKSSASLLNFLPHECYFGCTHARNNNFLWIY